MIDIFDERAKQRGWWRLFVTAPFIYAMYVPLLTIDAATQLYQAVCFPAYGIPLVDRKKFVRVGNRGKKTISWLDQINCAYCGYANGTVAYIREVLLQTEKYWCPIRHLPMKGFVAPAHHASFVEDGDEKALKKVICPN